MVSSRTQSTTIITRGRGLVFALWCVVTLSVCACGPDGIPSLAGIRLGGDAGPDASSPGVALDFTSLAPDGRVMAPPSEVVIGLAGCSSGLSRTYIIQNGVGEVRLWSQDSGCRVKVNQFTLAGDVYSVLPPNVFNTNVDTSTPFQSASGKRRWVVVTAQLDDSIDSADRAAFAIASIEEGQPVAVNGMNYETVSVTRDIAETSEGLAATVTFRIARSGPVTGPLLVNYSWTGSATAGADFSTTSGTPLTMPSTGSYVDIPATVINDAEAEKDETLQMTIDVGPAYLGAGNSAATIVYDNDATVPVTDGILWYDPSSLVFSANRVNRWKDLWGNLNPASQTSNPNMPGYLASAINGKAGASFDGSNDVLVVADSPTMSTATSFEGKTLFFMIKTGLDVTRQQVIWEQGGTSRGLNVYISAGRLYLNAWNLAADDATTPWGPKSVSGPVSPSSVYLVEMLFSRTQGSLVGYLNGANLGSVSGVGRLFAHAGGIGLGNVQSSTLAINGATITSAPWEGILVEALQYNRHLTEVDRISLENWLLANYGLNVTPAVSISVAPATIDEAGAVSATVTVSRSIAKTTSVSIPIAVSGTTTPGVDHGAVPIDVVIPAFETQATFTVTPINDTLEEGSEQLILTVSAPTGYVLGNAVTTLTMTDDDTWIPPAGSLIAQHHTRRGLNLSGTSVTSWNDLTGGGHTMTQTKTQDQPTLGTGLSGIGQAVVFDGFSEYLPVSVLTGIGTGGPFAAKTVSFVMRTGTDVTRRQVVFEQGSGTSGLNVHIEAGQIRVLGWNTTTVGSAIAWGPIMVARPAAINTTYAVVVELDGNAGELRLRLNGTLYLEIGAGLLPDNTSAGAFGAGNGTRFSSTVTTTRVGEHFAGAVDDILYYNRILTATELSNVYSYYRRNHTW